MQLPRIIIILASIFLYYYLAVLSESSGYGERTAIGIVAIVITLVAVTLSHIEFKKYPPSAIHIVVGPIAALSLFFIIRNKESLLDQIVLSLLIAFCIYITIVALIRYVRRRTNY